MNEVKMLGALLGALLVGAYLSWTKEDAPTKEEKTTILDVQKAQLEGLTFFAKTQTVAVSFRELEGKRYPWIEIEARKRKRGFTANTAFDEHLAKLAPFEAQRSLGRSFSAEELKQTELDKPKKKLELRFGGKSKMFDVGGRTSGARDHYVRPHGSDEVFLVESKVLADLEFPEGRFMQRKLRDEKVEDIEKVVISAALGTKTALHKNRLSLKDAFWADEAEPDTKAETIENYIDKLDKLVVTEYVEDEKEMKEAVPVMEVTWYGESEKSLGTTKILRKGADKTSTYYATSPATRVPVKVSRFTAEQLETDLKTLIGTK
jgi:hypothetical protein